MEFYIFCAIDDFCKEFDKNIAQLLLTGLTKGNRGPECSVSVSEIMTISILFQMVGYRNLKTFYTTFLQTYWKKYFPDLPGYTRFIELTGRSIFLLILFTQLNA